MEDSAKIATSEKFSCTKKRIQNNIFHYWKVVYVIMIVVSVHDGAVMVFCFYSVLFVKYTKDWETTNHLNLYHFYNAYSV